MFKKLIIGLFCFLFNNVIAQKYSLGDVTVEELNQKVCPIDSSAPAAVLFNVAKTTFFYDGDKGFSTMTEIITKIKIYKKEGYKYANHQEGFYVGGKSNSELVQFSKAVTYNLVNGKIEKSKLSGDGEFTENKNKFWSVKKITMPNVQEGSIIEFKTVINSAYFNTLYDWSFQKEIPVLYSEYTTAIPEYFIYNRHLKGFLNPEITQNSSERSVDYSYIKSLHETSVATGRIKGTLTFKEDVTKYVLRNIPAMKEEPYTNNIENYRSLLVFELSGTRYPNENYKSYAADWETVTNQIYQLEDFGGELNKTSYFEKDLETVLTGITNPEERINAVYNFVKSRMNWDGYTGITCNDGVKKAYQNQKGNTAEINLMLVAMLRSAGLNANPVILSTRSNGIALFPSRTAFNYVIAQVTYQDQSFLLDATDKNALPNIIPIQALNWSGREIQKDGKNTEVSLMPEFLSKETSMIMASIDSKEGKILGKYKQTIQDYDALRFRDLYGGYSNESHAERIEKNNKGIEIQNFTIQNVKELTQPVSQNYDFVDSNSLENLGGKLLVSPFLFETVEENPFKQDVREFPVDFIYPRQSRIIISLAIPEGYEVEVLPKSRALSMPNNRSSIKYNISSDEKNVQVMFTMDINQSLILPEEYDALKAYMGEFVKLNTEKIVLKKK